jgi:hypothetical protein
MMMMGNNMTLTDLELPVILYREQTVGDIIFYSNIFGFSFIMTFVMIFGSAIYAFMKLCYLQHAEETREIIDESFDMYLLIKIMTKTCFYYFPLRFFGKN